MFSFVFQVDYNSKMKNRAAASSISGGSGFDQVRLA